MSKTKLERQQKEEPEKKQTDETELDEKQGMAKINRWTKTNVNQSEQMTQDNSKQTP